MICMHGKCGEKQQSTGYQKDKKVENETLMSYYSYWQGPSFV